MRNTPDLFSDAAIAPNKAFKSELKKELLIAAAASAASGGAIAFIIARARSNVKQIAVAGAVTAAVAASVIATNQPQVLEPPSQPQVLPDVVKMDQSINR